MAVLSLPQGEIEYRFIPPGAGGTSVIVLLHEGLGSCAMWRDFPEKLAAATQCGVFAYSRLGYGRSSPVTLPRPLDYMTAEGEHILPDILDAAGIDKYILLGHSDGASIAAIFSGHRNDDRNCGIILMAPHFFTETQGLASIVAAKQAYETTDLRARLARYHDDVDNAFHGWNGAWLNPGFKAWNIEKYLPMIAVPILVIQGENDEYGTAKQPRAVRTHCRAPVTIKMLAECGHSPHRDQPEASLEAIAKFVKRVRPLAQ